MWIAIAAALALVRRSPRVLALVVAADAGADLLAELVKHLVRRHRPLVDQLGRAEHSYSFPSGHTSTSFACALVLAVAAPRLRIPLYVLAAAIACSRLYNGDHYPLDVVGGAVLGTLTALLLLAAARLRSQRGSRSG